MIFVLESVPAAYLPAYGGRYPVTPELEAAAGRSAFFTRIYAHGATTHFSIVSLLLSVYPWISYQSLTREHPGIPFPSLSSELDRRGYRTGFFNSADLRYQRLDAFLSHRKFDRLTDYRGLSCESPVLRASVKNPLLDSVDDECIVDAFLDWIGRPAQEPFLGILWTMMTHQPYFVRGPETRFVSDPAFNRYLNAVSHSDHLIGRLLRALEERGLQKSTLFVVLGDHGESFGQHGQRGHGSIYEESLHVPLILIHPTLFHGERYPVVGGLLDVAPTVLDSLGLEPPPQWRGRSLWSGNRSGRVYFFAPFGDHLFGFREGDRKVIYDATAHRFEIYDLARDPNETRNLASRFPDAARVGHERIAAWVQYQNALFNGLFGTGEER